MKNSILTKAALVACLVMASSAASHAQTLVNVNFDSTTGVSGTATADGAAVLGSAGDYWNNIGGNYALPSGTLSNSGGLVNSANTATGIVLSSSTGSPGEYSDGGSNGPINPSFLMSGYSFGDQTLTLTLPSADVGDTFTLEVYGAGNVSGQGSTFTLSGAATGTGTTTGTDRTIAGGSGDAYYEFTGTLASTTLNISAVENHGDLTGNGNGGTAIVDGLQLELVPEPSSWSFVLAGLCGLGVVLRFRRKMVA